VRQAERAADRLAWSVERQADRVQARVHTRVARELRSTMRESRRTGRGSWDQQSAISDNPCADADRWDDDQYRHCEVREERLPAGPLAVDAGQNGGIRVEGWDGNDILVRAVVQASARNEADAKAMAGQVEVRTGGGRVTSIGPSRGNREWWSVSYRISVPHRTDLDLNASNGGITIANVTGAITFDTTNGGVRLADLSGRVNGRTRNGGVNVMLGGSSWEGEGLDVETSNGGVTLSIPASYNAQLETRTVNGGFRFDYPLTLSGELSPRRGIITTLGSGGAPVRVRTTNGGLKLQQR
jgi:Putative adhesin